MFAVLQNKSAIVTFFVTRNEIEIHFLIVRKETMAKTTDKNGNATLPGTIYSRNGRYWYKVQLPGEGRPVTRLLKAAGSKFATADYSAAVAWPTPFISRPFSIATSIFRKLLFLILPH